MTRQAVNLSLIGTTRDRALDGLRGIAALMVFFSHVAMMTWFPREGGAAPNDLEYAMWHLGAPAVDLFFVLSGYVLAASLEGVKIDGATIGSFLARRWVRLMPVAWVGVALGLAVRTLIVPMQQDPLVGMINMDQPLRWQDWVGFITFTFPMPDTDRFNVPLWTLVMEMYASFLIPVTVAGVRKKGRLFLLPAFTSWIILWYVSGRLEFMTLPLFVLGVAVRVYAADLPRKSLKVALMIGLLLVFSRYLLDVLHVWQRYVSGVGAALLILAVRGGAARAFLTCAPVGWLGKISYPFYAVHFPLVVASSILLSAKGVGSTLAAMMALPVALAVAEVVHRTIEQLSIRTSRRMAWKGKSLAGQRLPKRLRPLEHFHEER
ncbi:acyltransferase family protein [Sphingomonas sp. 3-13AW]|uniref:acyltransferase family protein n=1 Tax=Sphingomonas sp. 3-13AW TaxID=3050450 RepID=UPI003BB5D67C